MNLAAVLRFSFLSVAFLSPLACPCFAQAVQQTGAATDSSSGSQKTAAPSTSPAAPKSHLQKAHRKTASAADCSTAPATLNPNPGASADPTKTTTTTQPGSGTASTNAGTGNSTKTSAGSNAATKPCPPPKKVVQNGGSDEPAIQLLGGTTADQAASQRSTEELTAATEDNLKKLSAHDLSATEQETVNQIKQFIQQSKEAVAAGDAQRGHDLAMKARLLSDQLVKP
jgi:hypothetical protein